jgi:hypothetical protein
MDANDVRLVVITRRYNVIELSTILGRASDRPANVQAPNAVWTLQSRCDCTARIESHLQDIIEQLDSLPSLLKNVPDGCDVFVSWCCTASSWSAGGTIGADCLHALARYGLAIDIDFQFIGETLADPQ